MYNCNAGDGTVTLPKNLKHELLSRADGISMLPAVASEAMTLVEDENCTIAQLAGIVERDVKLAAEILSLSNSSIFSRGKLVTSLNQAIIRIGFRQCQGLILAAGAASLMKELPVKRAHVRDMLWQHSSTTAIACLFLNRALGLGFHGEEYSAGLLHDFGRILLTVAAEDVYTEVDRLDFREDCDTLARERELLGTDHCEFGAWFGEHIGLPKPLVEVIRWHHEPSCAHRKLVALTAAGDHLANHLLCGERLEDYDPESNWAITQLGALCHRSLVERFHALASTLILDIAHDAAQLNTAKSSPDFVRG